MPPAFLLALAFAFAGADPRIAEINAWTARVDSLVGGGSFRCLRIAETSASEGVPPGIESCTDGASIQRIRIEAGHESWTESATFWFRDGRVAKVLETADIPGSPRRQAILYRPDGTVLWKNMEAPRVDPARLLRVVASVDSLRRRFSGAAE